jgi:cobalt-zinc-cadmium efflux system outer membrane protein
VTGCASVPADRGARDVHDLLAVRGESLASQPLSLSTEAPTPESQVAALLAEPLTAQRAVGVALLRNPELRVVYAQLGLVQADWLDASRLSNPVLSFSALDSNQSGAGTRIGFGLVQNFTDLLFLRSRSRIAAIGRDQAEAEAAAAIQQLAADVEAHYYEAVGAAQLAQMRGVIAKAASASAELAQRFKDAGNINALELAREKAAAHRALIEQDAAQAQAATSLLALNQIMGLAPPITWALQTRLPLPVDETLDAEALIERALRDRLDLVAKQREIEAIEGVLGLARTLRWIPFVEVGIDGEREDDARLLGPTVAIEIPLFGKNQSDTLRAQAQYERAKAEAEAIRSSVTNGVAAAVAEVDAARSRVQRHREGLVPESEAVVARMQELQNYMIVGQFELLLAKQEEYEAYAGYLESLRDYWLARVELGRVVGVDLPGDAPAGAASVDAITLPAAAADAHSGHAGMNHGAEPAKPMDHSAHAMPDTEAATPAATATPSQAPSPHSGH